MLKNISSEPIILRWGGKELTLLPGKRCRYQDSKVEQRQKAKHGATLEWTVEAKSQAKDEAVVMLDEAAVPTVPELAVPTEAVGGLTCSACSFEAKSPAGLDVHIRAKHPEK